MTLGRYQSDYDDDGEYSNVTDATTESDGDNDSQDEEETTTTTTRMHGCKLRPDEGLDSISSLAPGSISSNLLVGGTNTVYAWLIQWLADNLGYDVTSIVALPYDWRLSPDKMESRDGFLTLMRKKIEAAVESNGLPGIMVAHSVSSCCLLQLLLLCLLPREPNNPFVLTNFIRWAMLCFDTSSNGYEYKCNTRHMNAMHNKPNMRLLLQPCRHIIGGRSGEVGRYTAI